jgi:peptidoglycan hydrolase-like protein with peptidoglycan-binding domain/tetratricopeptide (TPR) repeat protein
MTLRFAAGAVTVLALAFPAPGLGATSATHQKRAATNTRESAGRAGAAALLALGSGYNTPFGSSRVRVVQRRLAQAGFTPGPIDGRYGPLTSRAVIAFQASHGLEVDGIVGPRTWTALTPSRLVLVPGAGDQPGGSNLVRALQRRLALAGYSPGRIDGRYGAHTELAVRHFQSAHGLRADGLAGLGTIARLGQRPHSPHRPSSPRAPRTAGPRANTHGARNPAPVTHKPLNHPTNQPSILLVVLCAVAWALLLLGAWLVTVRRRRRVAPAPSDRHRADPAVTGNVAAVAANGNGGKANGARALPDQVDLRGDASNAFNLALSLQEQGDLTGAQAAYRHADEHADEHAAVAATGNGAKSNGARAARDPVAPRADASNAFNLGLSLQEQGDLTGAQAAYRHADEYGHGPAASNLGALLEEQGASAEAEAAYRRADRRGDATGAFNLGVLLQQRGVLAEAEAAYRRAEQRGHGAAASNLGVLLEERGALTEAEEAYRRAARSGEATGAFNLGVLLQERGALAEAATAYRRARQCGDPEVAGIARAALRDLQKDRRERSVSRSATSHDDD